jgi:GTP-binding protein
MTKPLVALVGRPNVGKSTLFNRLVGERLAVVDETPGTTRDRIEAEGDWNGRAFTIVDTGGIEALPAAGQRRIEKSKKPLAQGAEHTPLAVASADFIPQIREQAEMAIEAADAVVLVVDATSGITAADEEVADILRRTSKPVFVAANKAESAQRRDEAVEFYGLGLGEVFPVSAIHGIGTGDLLDAVVASFPPLEEEAEDESVKIAIVGRPNVGKSSLLNAILGQERAIVSPIPGTTRDAIDTRIVWETLPITLIDTAGIRRRGHIEVGVEKYSVLRALKAIQRADVALLLIDAMEGVTAQDAHIAGFILEESKSTVVVVNKWDAVPGKTSHTMDEYTAHVRSALNFMDYVPVLFISAKLGTRVDSVLPTAVRVQEERLIRIPTGELNRIIRGAMSKQMPPTKAGKRLNIYYATQPRTDPPTFVFYVNDKELVHFSYERYLENQIREAYGFLGTPLRFSFRERKREEYG